MLLGGINITFVNADVSDPEEILTISADEVGPASKIVVTVVDDDLNIYGASPERVMGLVTVYSDRDTKGKADLYIDETGRDTGVFTGMFTGMVSLMPSLSSGSKNSGSNNVIINVLPNDTVYITYTDLKSTTGMKNLITKTAKVIAFDPEMDIKFENHSKDRMLLSVFDIDANKDASKVDTLILNATSMSTGANQRVTAFETGPNTSYFESVIVLSLDPAPGTLTRQECEALMFVEYVDSFPADFASRLEEKGDLAASKVFRISGGWIAGCLPSAYHELKILNSNGGVLHETMTGYPLTISMDVTNRSMKDKSMTVISDIRNRDGITMQIVWASAVIPAGEKYNVSTMWIPDVPGPYQIRSFVVSSFEKPEILSEVIYQEITIL